MATLTGKQLKDSYQGLLTIKTADDANPLSGRLENGLGNAITALGIGTDSPFFTTSGRASFSLNGTSSSLLAFGKNGSSENYILADAGGFTIANTSASLPTTFYNNGLNRAQIKSSGDISFRDTSANEAFYWDASTARLGLGTTSPSTKLQVEGGRSYFFSGDAFSVALARTASQANYAYLGTDTDGDFNVYDTSGNSRLIVEQGGNVGIGVTPSATLHIDNPANPTSLRIGSNTTDDCFILFNTDGNDWAIGADRSASNSFKISDNSSLGTADRLVIDTSGKVGIGVSPSAKLHVNDTTYPTLRLSTATSYSNIYHDGTTGSLIYSADDGGDVVGRTHQFYTSGAEKLRIDNNGDTTHIASYSSSTTPFRVGYGTYASFTPTFLIDDNGNVGIGSSDPQTTLHLSSTSPELLFNDTNAGTDVKNYSLYTDGGKLHIRRLTDSYSGFTPTMTFDQSNVGIGTDSPSVKLDIKGTVGIQATNSTNKWLAYTYTDNTLRLNYNGAGNDEVVIDSSGNVLVGKTSADLDTVGAELRANGIVGGTVSGGNVLWLNRTTSDGNIAIFSKDGTTVGSIGTVDGQLFIGNEAGSVDAGLLFGEAGTTARAIIPSRAEGTVVDNALDLGYASGRFKDLYLGGNVILSSGQGIDFSATADGSGTMTSELLDDYEEGTWTPVLRGSGTAGTYETTTAEGYYTKVGNMVSLTARVALAGSITGGGSGYAQITGAPFAKGANTSPQGSVRFVGVDINNVGKYANVSFTTYGAGSTLYFTVVADNASAIDQQISGFSASDEISFSLTYFV